MIMCKMMKCERCKLSFSEESIVDVDGKDGWGELCEDCAESLIWEEGE